MVRPKRTAAPVTGDDEPEPQAKKKPGKKGKSKTVLPDVVPPVSGQPRADKKVDAAAAATVAAKKGDKIANGHQKSAPLTEAGPSATALTSSAPITVKEAGDEAVRKRGRKLPAETVSVPESNRKYNKKLKIARCRRHDRGQGQVLVCGQNDVGQLGLGDTIMERKRPTLVAVADVDVNSVGTVVDVCAGGMHTVCLAENGMVFTFGCNDEGALGRDTSVEGSECTPGKVELPEGKTVIQVSAGDSHTAALTDDGHVFVWGNFRDASGAMGLLSAGLKEDRPVRVNLSDEVVKISSGSDHLVLLTTDGSVLTLGIAEQGQLGRVGERFATRNGRKGTTSMLSPTPVMYTKAKYGKLVFDNVWATTHATFTRVKGTNQIFATGLNNYNQLGITGVDSVFFLEPVPSFSGRKWIEIAGDIHHTLALDDAGQVHVLGRKEYGRLGLGEDGEDKHEPTVVPSLALVKCVDISCGTSTSYAVASNGAAYAWGMGSSNQLGNADEEDRWQPCQIRGKPLANLKIIAASGGAQHAVLLAHNAE